MEPAALDTETHGRLLDNVDVGGIATCVMQRLARCEASVAEQMGKQDHLLVGPRLGVQRVGHAPRYREAGANGELVEPLPTLER